MGLSALDAFLRRHGKIALDTSIFIYHLESNAKYLPLTSRILSWIERAGSRAVTSTITMTELLVQPYRARDVQRVDEFYALLSTYPNLDWIPVNLEIADLASRIRGIHQLRTPDALQAATAIHEHATGFLSNDPILNRIAEIDALVLERLL